MENKTCGECKRKAWAKDGLCRSLPDNHPAIASCFEPKVITNGDRIRQMSNDELIKFKERAWCFYCAYHVDGGGRFTGNCNKPAGKTCADGNKEWLNAPAESEKL